jgi:hypothetical protein
MEIEDGANRIMRFITSPDRFASQFNALVPGAYRSITVQDIKDLHECGLIGRYDYYGRQDIQIVRLF